MWPNRNLNDIFCIDTSRHVGTELDLAVESILDRDSYDAYYHLACLIYEEISSIPNDNTLGHSFFRFTRLPVLNRGKVDERKPVIDDIRNQALTFSNPSLFNDPMDPIIREWVKWKRESVGSSREQKLFNHLKKSLDNIRICCLSINHLRGIESMHLNPLMWAHYADMHKGVCLEYEITEEMLANHNDKDHVLRVSKVRYRDRKVMSDYITLDNALLAKGSCWEYEHESRLIYYSKEEASVGRKIDNYVSLAGFRIIAVYLGYRISDEDKRDVIAAAMSRGINVYQVRFDRNDITSLTTDSVLL